MRIAIFIIVALVCVHGTSGWLSGSRSRRSNTRTSVNAGGWVDSQGNWGVKAGITISWRKRSIDWNGKHFDITFTVNQCNFNVYDADDDGYITMSDILSIFGDEYQAENFFNDLNLASDDNKVDEEEFNFLAPKTIKGCEDAAIPDSA